MSFTDTEIEKIWLLSESHVRVPTYSSTVYNDECLFSFTTPFDGLYVNLKSWRGFAKSFLHHDLKVNNGVGVYAYLKYTKEYIDQSEQVAKATKVAIGTTDGFNTEGFRIEKFAKIVIVSPPEFFLDREFNLEDPNIPEPIITAARAVMEHKGARDQEAVKAWEAEDIRPVTVYAESMIQENNGKKISTNPADWVCEQTGFKDGNLWLNLHDGFIGSGRRNFDGSGGTNGAVDHYQSVLRGTGKKYPLVVKLGTITPDGNADVYSYADDEDMMVTDPLLVAHLAHWKIDISKMSKSDKTMSEMEVELNKDFAFDKIVESGENLIPVDPGTHVGLTNMGNTCYLNSIVQLLSHVSEIPLKYSSTMEMFTSVGQKILKFTASEQEKDWFQFTKLVSGLEQGHQSPICPHAFRSQLTRNHPEFSTNRQQDAIEFLLHILKQLGRTSTSIESLFNFQIQDKLEVDDGFVKYTNRKETVFPLTVSQAEGEEKTVTFEKCFQRTISKTSIEGFRSPVTGLITEHAFKSFTISTMPDYLLVSVNRYFFDEKFQPAKLDCAVLMPTEIDLEQYRAKPGVLLPGEKPLPNMEAQSESTATAADDSIVEQLVAMGFDEPMAKRACIATKNAGAETALQWVLSGAPESTPATAADPESVMMLVSMGFSESQAQKALEATGGNLERAADYLFSRAGESMDDETGPRTMTVADSDGLGKYKLLGFVSHIGKSTSVGHYVCHIRHGDDWIIFNDEKVAKSVQPPLGYGYLYLYKRKA